MIDTADFMDGLEQAGILFTTGVPDSLLKDICACFSNKYGPNQHVIATNEGSAVGLAIGHYLATARPALVYLQNSGLGNVVNPVTSLADPLVYGVPMVLMIGWRGELLDDQTQLADEPQHVKQGQVTLALLDTLGIPFRIIDANTAAIDVVLKQVAAQALARSGPVALVVRKNTFTRCDLTPAAQPAHELSREEAIRLILAALPADAVIVSTTGMASRELFELRKHAAAGHQRDFLTVGGMGHALPYLIPDFSIATWVSIIIVFFELWAISWIRNKYMDTPFLKAAFQIVVGGFLVFLTGILIGSA